MSAKKITGIFADSLGIPESEVNDELKYNSIAQWDSIAHMALVAALENAFGVTLDTQDILDLSSVAKAKEILNKYGVVEPC